MFRRTSILRVGKQSLSSLKEQHNVKQDKWISGEEAMLKLRIKSPSTLQELRDRSLIRFTQPSKKIILYDIDSIEEYLEKHSHNNS